ncbi:MAG TPA: succinate dehydrogenase/fumarate reductase iron-sulfur subunit [Solirubrobacteraceae bacterium]|jgi:succinate dehydrogenase / fumarate reductase iron-sulfur subunit
MPEYALRIQRFNPEAALPEPRWEQATVELDAHRSVLDAILALKERDGTLAIRYSCRAAVCGSCAVRICGRTRLACHTPLSLAAGWAGEDGAIVVEPMGNMPVLKDLIVDMDAVHWAKIGRVQPWLAGVEPAPAEESVVPHEAMVDVTQTQACIQCGACVSDCLSLEVDPLFVGPAALAKALRFVADPRDARHAERLTDLAEDPHGMYDCTHCFNCIEACPTGVQPMNQIMRLRRATDDRGHRRSAFADEIRRSGRIVDARLLTGPPSGPRAKLGAVVGGLRRPRVEPPAGLRRAFDEVAARPARVELNLYVSGYEEDGEGGGGSAAGSATDATPSAPGPNARRPRGSS